MICKNCGANNPDGKLFCSECGARLDDAKACPNCGAVTNGKFCPDCGYDLRETENSGKCDCNAAEPERETEEVVEANSKRKRIGEWFIFVALVLTVLGETYFWVMRILQYVFSSDLWDVVQDIVANIGNMVIFAGAITALILFFGKNRKKKKYAFFSAFSVFLFIAKNGSFVSIINCVFQYFHYKNWLGFALVRDIIPTVALIAGVLYVLGCVLCCDKFGKNSNKRVFAGCILCIVGLISVLFLDGFISYMMTIIFFLCRKVMEHFELEFVINNQIGDVITLSISDGIAVLIAFTAYRFMTETREKAHFVNIILSGQILLISSFQFLFYGNGFLPFIITTIALALIAFLCAVLNFTIRKGVERKPSVRIKK